MQTLHSVVWWEVGTGTGTEGAELIAHAGRLCSHIFHKLRIRHVKRLARTPRAKHTLQVTGKSAPSALSGHSGQVGGSSALASATHCWLLLS